MPFTREEVSNVIESAISGWHHESRALLLTSDAYEYITAYLTGENPTLQSFQSNPYSYVWQSLLTLLQNIEHPSEKEQLLIEVIYDRNVKQSMEEAMREWMMRYIDKRNTESALKAVLQYFNRMHMPERDAFRYMVSFLHYQRRDVPASRPEGIFREFLLTQIRNSTNPIFPQRSSTFWGRDRTMIYFELLEEARPEWLSLFTIYEIKQLDNNFIYLLADYKQGHYLPMLLPLLGHQENDTIEISRAKFDTAMVMAATKPERYTSLAIEKAYDYIADKRRLKPKERYEGTHELPVFANVKGLQYLDYTPCAIHYILQDKPEEAIRITTEMFAEKQYVHTKSLRIIYSRLPEGTIPLFQAALQADGTLGGVDYYKEMIDMMEDYAQPAHYLPLLWNLTNNKSKPLRERVARIIGEKDPDAVAKAIPLLEHKNADTRQTAAIILSYFSTPEARNAIQQAISTETNDVARDILLQTVEDTLPTAASYEIVADIIKEAADRGKLKKPVESFLEEAELPALFYADGRQVEADAVRFLLYRMKRIKEMTSDMEARYVIQLLDKEKAAPFALAMIKLFNETGTRPEYKYMLALAALLGNDSIVDKIRTTINKWIEESRYKMAEYGVGALALQGSNKALRWVEWYSRKYRTKKANVGAAALVALETAAKELGITAHELGDRIVPDFDFDGLFKHFTAGGEEYRAFIDSNFKIAFFNEDNKKLKSIPASADAELKEEFKAIAKEVKDITKSQSSRLEYYLVIQRRWTFEQWQAFFLQNPVMFIYATKLLWGVYDSQGILTQTFLCLEDTTLQDVNQEEITLADDAIVGIIHPSQLSPELLQQWKQLCFDLEIIPIFPQLERSLPDMKDIEPAQALIRKFEGRKMKTGGIRTTLERLGWHKGPVGDGGFLESFRLLHAEKNLEAVLELEGVGAGFGWSDDERLGRLYVLDRAKYNGRWGFYPKSDEDERIVKVKELPGIFLSEMLAAVEAIPVAEAAEKEV